MSCSRTAADDPGDPRGTGGCTRGTGACTKPFPSAVLSHAYGAPRRGDEHCSLAALRTGTFRQRPRWSCPASYRSSDHSPKGGFPPERAEGSSGSPTRSARLWRENSVSSSASLTDRDLRALVGLLDDGRTDDAGPAMPKNCGSVSPAHRPMRPRWRVFGPQGVKYLLDGDIHRSGRTSRRPTGDAKRRLSRAPRLTPREWQVLDLVAQGHSNAEIAKHTRHFRQHCPQTPGKHPRAHRCSFPQRGRGTDAAGCHRPGPFEAGTASDLVRSTKR